MKQKSAKFEKKYFKGEDNNYFSSLEYKMGNLRYLYERKIRPILKNQLVEHDKILDVGCALGVLLSMLDKDGFETYGVDISRFAISEAKKRTKAALQIFDVNQNFSYQDNSFAAVFAIDIIEHLESPARFLLETKRVLKKGGYLFIHTPNINSFFEKIFGKNWFGYKDKTHLYLFNRKSLRFIVEQSGYKIINCETILYPAPVTLRPFLAKTDLGGTVWLIAQK